MMSVQNPHIILLSLAVLIGSIAILLHAIRLMRQPPHAHKWVQGWPFDQCDCGDIRASNVIPRDGQKCFCRKYSLYVNGDGTRTPFKDLEGKIHEAWNCGFTSDTKVEPSTDRE